MIVITSDYDLMSRGLIAQAIGHDKFYLVNKFPGGALHLHSREKKTSEQDETFERRETRRAVIELLNHKYEGEEVRLGFAIYANSPYTHDRRKYPWKPTGETAQLKGLSALLDDCEKTIMNHVIYPNRLPAQRLLYVDEVETGIFWIDFTDLNNPIRIVRSEE